MFKKYYFVHYNIYNEDGEKLFTEMLIVKFNRNPVKAMRDVLEYIRSKGREGLISIESFNRV